MMRGWMLEDSSKTEDEEGGEEMRIPFCPT